MASPHPHGVSNLSSIRLKPGSFLLVASHSHCWLAGVAATTLARQKRVTIHRRWRRSYLPHATMQLATEDIHRSDHIAMRLKPTGRAAIDAPPWFVALVTARIGTSFTRMLLIHQDNAYT